jgi:hypothetical protein
MDQAPHGAEGSMKRVVAGGALALAALTSGSARAERSNLESSGMALRKNESPQNFALEFRFSPYRPDIDDEPSLNGQKPYENVFGTMPRLLFQIELDWQALRIPHVGTLGPGLAVGFTNMSAPARLTNGRGVAAEDTSLEIFPAYAVAVFRADVILRELRFPIVPYVKGGFGAARWRAYGPLGTSSSGGVSGKGTTYGTQVAIGATLSLNFLDKAGALNLDNSVGINQTHLFFEFYSAGLNGLGQTNALHVGTTSWAAGLAFEF